MTVRARAVVGAGGGRGGGRDRRAGDVILFVDTGTAAGAAVALESATSLGTDPFTRSVTIGEVADFPTTIAPITRTVTAKLTTDTTTGGLTTTGNTPGLYGGTGNERVCDPHQLADYLTRTPDQSRRLGHHPRHHHPHRSPPTSPPSPPSCSPPTPASPTTATPTAPPPPPSHPPSRHRRPRRPTRHPPRQMRLRQPPHRTHQPTHRHHHRHPLDRLPTRPPSPPSPPPPTPKPPSPSPTSPPAPPTPNPPAPPPPGRPRHVAGLDVRAEARSRADRSTTRADLGRQADAAQRVRGREGAELVGDGKWVALRVTPPGRTIGARPRSRPRPMAGRLAPRSPKSLLRWPPRYSATAGGSAVGLPPRPIRDRVQTLNGVLEHRRHALEPDDAARAYRTSDPVDEDVQSIVFGGQTSGWSRPGVPQPGWSGVELE